MYSPKIEPEIVFKLKRPLGGRLEAAAVLEAVEWLALGFEIIDCVFPDWKFQPADFVAAFGLHAALIVGEPHAVEPATIPALVEQLPRFKLRLTKHGALVEEGSGKASLRSPALCLGELAAGIARQAGADPLAAGELIRSEAPFAAVVITGNPGNHRLDPWSSCRRPTAWDAPARPPRHRTVRRRRHRTING